MNHTHRIMPLYVNDLIRRTPNAGYAIDDPYSEGINNLNIGSGGLLQGYIPSTYQIPREFGVFSSRRQSGLLSEVIVYTESNLEAGKKIIQEIANLEAGWDGEDAKKLDRVVINNALIWLEIILADTPPPDIFPNENGTISFEWVTELATAHIEIGKTKYIFFINGPESTLSTQNGLAVSVSDLLPITWAMKRHLFPPSMDNSASGGLLGWYDIFAPLVIKQIAPIAA